VTTLFDSHAISAAGAVSGVIGRRFLSAVQTFSIGRLTSHPVPLVPGRFVAVTGRGPDNDSNGSGKTTFLGAIALLCGDPYWGLAGGSDIAAGLLFNPDPAGVSRDEYPPADTGYIVGLFEGQDGTDQLTVWLKITAGSPIRVRWACGVHLVAGDSEAARLRAADETWASLGSEGTELKSNFAAALYGDAPRCLAWLEARANEVETKPTLLAANLAGFSPAHIGQELVKLCGRATAADEDVEQRRKLDQLQRDLGERRQQDEAASAREDVQLASIHRRNEAAATVRAARAAWRLHFARGWLDALDRLEDLTAGRAEVARLIDGTQAALVLARQEHRSAQDLGALQAAFDAAEQEFTDAKGSADGARKAEWEADEAVRRAEAHRNDVIASAAAWDGSSVTEATEAAEAARAAAAEAELEVREARRAFTAAERDLDAARAGRAGRAGETAGRLQQAGVPATVLLDAVLVAEGARTEWEPRLALYADAVAVGSADRDAAVSAGRPGDVIVSSPERSLPAGITEAPAEASGFLHSLAHRVSGGIDPAGVTVVGGFQAPITGRAARVAAAELALTAAAESRRLAEVAHRDAVDTEQRVAIRLSAAVAASEVDAAKAAVSGAGEVLDNARSTAAAARSVVEVRGAARDKALTRLSSAKALAEVTEAKVRELEGQLTGHLNEDKRLADIVENLDLTYWVTGWGSDDPDTAREALAADRQGGRVEMSSDSYRKSATDAAAAVLGMLDLLDPAAAPTADIASAVRDRSDPFRSNRPETTERLLGALAAWLADVTALDAVTADRIETDRIARRQGIATADDTCHQAQEALIVIQDAIVRSVRTRLEAVERELDRLNRAAGKFGAELALEIHAPERPDDRWRWEVAPRWKRAPGGRMLDYRTIANSAQAKLFSVHLVVAALFASGEGRGSLLILDELGNSLGAQHRREVLRSLADVAAAEGITVLGTCQDDLLVKAAEVCGEEVVFERTSASDVLNAPVRVWGYDDNRVRVEGLADFHRTGRRLG
jgi:hypothetical protein